MAVDLAEVHAVPLLSGEMLALPAHPAPVASSSWSLPFLPVSLQGNEKEPHSCQTQRSRQQAVFLRTNFSVLYLAVNGSWECLHGVQEHSACLAPLLPALIKIGWKTLLGLQRAYPLLLFICIPNCL